MLLMRRLSSKLHQASHNNGKEKARLVGVSRENRKRTYMLLEMIWQLLQLLLLRPGPPQ